MDKYEKIVVGQKFPYDNILGLEGFFFINTGGTPTLLCAFPNMTDAEVQQLSNGGRIGLFMYEDIIFVSFKNGNLDGDSVYHVSMYENQPTEMPPIPDGMGYSLQILGIDSATGIVKKIRMCGMGAKWSQSFAAMIAKQAQMPFDRDDFFRRVSMLRLRWSSKDIIKMSETYKLGANNTENDQDANWVELQGEKFWFG